MASRTNLSAVKTRLNVINLGMMLGFLAIGMLLVFWSVVRGQALSVRDDNPRYVDAALSTMRGRILDRNGLVLVSSEIEDGGVNRTYVSPGAGPAVGFYSFRYGTSGIENGLDAILSGESGDYWRSFWENAVLHEPVQGMDVKSTLSHNLQAELDELMHDFTGAAILFTVSDYEILAMSSQPGYDPNILDSQFDELVNSEEAPLLNRVTQGQYQPGLILQPFVVAILSDSLIDFREDVLTNADSEVVVDGNPLACDQPVSKEELTWADAIASQCPGPLSEIGLQIGPERISDLFDQLGLFQEDETIIPTEVVDEVEISDSADAILGYDSLVTSPLKIASLLVALANDGKHPQPQLILGFQDANGTWKSIDSTIETQLFSQEAASGVLNAIPRRDGIIEQASLSNTDLANISNAWYMGLYPANDPQYGIVLILEDQDNISTAEQIGRTLLKDANLIEK